jgi:hypothetical protein
MRSNTMSTVTAASTAPTPCPAQTISNAPLAHADKPAQFVVACALCGRTFQARRSEAKCCSGRCRIALCRARRVAYLVRRLEAAEAALVAAEQAIASAAVALRDLRVLAEQGGAKLAP